METLGTTGPVAIICTICGDRRTKGSPWFVVTQKTCEDRLNVCNYDADGTLGSNDHALCCPQHVRALVVHWMATGCLHYPFARAANTPGSLLLNSTSPANLSDDQETSASQLCEIVVDRAAISRILLDNPLTLNTILEELIIVLESDIEAGESDIDMDGCFAASIID